MQVQHRRIGNDDLVQPRPCRHGVACLDAVSAPARPLLLLLLGWRCRRVLAALHQLLQRQCHQRLPSNLLMVLVILVWSEPCSM